MNYQVRSGTERFAEFCEAVEAAQKEHKVPGVAVGVICGDEEFSAGFGVTNVNHPLPVDADTLFQIGSTTKTFTATVAIQLVEASKLELDRPIRHYLPNLELRDPEVTAKVTLRHLFTHTGGWMGDFFIDTGRGDDALHGYMKRMKELRQEVPLGETFAYNNSGFSLAGAVIQEVAGKAYEQVVKEMLLEPLGMEMSFFFPEEVMIHRFTVGHTTSEEGETTVAKPWAMARASHPAGGIASSVRDQLRYARFHLGDGTTTDGKQLLKTATLKHMQQPQVKIPFNRELGISWLIKHPGGLRLVAHGGATNEQFSAFELVPDHNFALVLMTNGTGGRKLVGLMTQKALEIYFNMSVPESEVIKMSQAELASYAGCYESLAGTLELTPNGNGLIITAIPKAGYPTEESPPLPAPPPCPFVFIGPDQIEAREGSLQGVKAEFARHDDGSIRWLHFFGRIHHRLEQQA